VRTFGRLHLRARWPRVRTEGFLSRQVMQSPNSRTDSLSLFNRKWTERNQTSLRNERRKTKTNELVLPQWTMTMHGKRGYWRKYVNSTRSKSEYGKDHCKEVDRLRHLEQLRSVPIIQSRSRMQVQTDCRVVSESATIAISQVILLNREFRLMLAFFMQIFGSVELQLNDLRT